MRNRIRLSLRFAVARASLCALRTSKESNGHSGCPRQTARSSGFQRKSTGGAARHIALHPEPIDISTSTLRSDKSQTVAIWRK